MTEDIGHGFEAHTVLDQLRGDSMAKGMCATGLGRQRGSANRQPNNLGNG